MTIKPLIRKLGGPAKVAAMCGIRPQAVSQWRQVPIDRCIEIERATAGAVSRSDLRPDIWPPNKKKAA